jgi:hypothetical protein
VGAVVKLFRGPVARLYRRGLTDQGFEVLMVAVFDIAARQELRRHSCHCERTRSRAQYPSG